MFIGFNLTFAPMHWLGLAGHGPSHLEVRPGGSGLETWNVAVSVGAFVIALSILVFMINWYRSRRHGEIVGTRPLGRPDPRVDDPQPDPGVQLRHVHRS